MSAGRPPFLQFEGSALFLRFEGRQPIVLFGTNATIHTKRNTFLTASFLPTAVKTAQSAWCQATILEHVQVVLVNIGNQCLSLAEWCKWVCRMVLIYYSGKVIKNIFCQSLK